MRCVCTSIDRTGRCEHVVGDREVVLGLDRDRVEAAAGDVVERAQHGRGRAPVVGRAVARSATSAAAR